MALVCCLHKLAQSFWLCVGSPQCVFMYNGWNLVKYMCIIHQIMYMCILHTKAGICMEKYHIMFRGHIDITVTYNGVI